MARRTFSGLGLCLAALTLTACESLPVPSLKPALVEHPSYKIGAAYKIKGVTYHPAENWSYDETGTASWYGEEFDGKYTANGEVFDLNEITAAHRTLPLPSIVQVTDLRSGRSLRVRVNDRGPYDGGRILDLSRRAAQLLGFETQGTTKIRVQLLFAESLAAAKLAGRKGPDPKNPATLAKPAPPEPSAPAVPPAPTEPVEPTDKIVREALPPPDVTFASIQQP